MGYINYPDIKPPTKSKQNMQTSIKTAQTEMNTVDTETAPNPQWKQCKQTGTINVISSNMNLEEDMLTKPHKEHANLHNEHNNAKVNCQRQRTQPTHH